MKTAIALLALSFATAAHSADLKIRAEITSRQDGRIVVSTSKMPKSVKICDSETPELDQQQKMLLNQQVDSAIQRVSANHNNNSILTFDTDKKCIKWIELIGSVEDL